jgi:hypothetical protein
MGMYTEGGEGTGAFAARLSEGWVVKRGGSIVCNDGAMNVDDTLLEVYMLVVPFEGVSCVMYASVVRFARGCGVGVERGGVERGGMARGGGVVRDEATALV